MDEKVCIKISYKHVYSLTGQSGEVLLESLVADWGSHGKFLNYSEYGNDIMYAYITKKVWNISHHHVEANYEKLMAWHNGALPLYPLTKTACSRRIGLGARTMEASHSIVWTGLVERKFLWHFSLYGPLFF